MKIFLFLMILIGSFLQSLASGQINNETADIVMSYSKKMNDHTKNMGQMGKISGSLNDREVGVSIMDICLMVEAKTDHMHDLLFVHQLVNNASEKNIISKLVEFRRKNIIKIIELQLEVLNHGISQLQNQGMIASAIQLRTDMREMQSFFNKLKIESNRP